MSTTANGRALVPFTVPASMPLGPVSALPQENTPNGAEQPRTVPGKPRRWALAVSAFRRNWWRLVFASVGAVAAVVSYGHIVALFLSWHATLLDARLMPVAIDGLIIIGAGAAKGGQKRLGWSAIGPGLAASLYANVMNGLPYGYGAAMGSGWATVALFLATNVMERWKAAPAGMTDDEGARPGQPGKNGGDGTGLAGSPVRNVAAVAAPAVTPRHDGGDKPPRKLVKPPQGATKFARAAAAIRDNPGLTNAELAALAGCDTRTISRARNGKAPLA